MSLLVDALQHLHGGPLSARLVLRGSLLTALWVPGRRANDVDVLVDGPWTVDTLRPHVVDAMAGLRGADVTVETIWAETPFPGLRARVARGEEATQVDFGWGEQLAAPPVDTVVHERTWRAVRPEVMVGWKVHSLVEHGERGRWHAKTLADLVLYERHVAYDRALASAAVRAAFASQAMPLSRLDSLLSDPTWGGSRGSRSKWRAYRKKAAWVDFTLEEALATARQVVRTLVG